MATRYTVEPSVDVAGFNIVETVDGVAHKTDWFPDALRAFNDANDRNRALGLREARALHAPQSPDTESSQTPRAVITRIERCVSEMADLVSITAALPAISGQLPSAESREAVLVYAGQGLRIIADRLGHVRASLPEVEPQHSTGEELSEDVSPETS